MYSFECMSVHQLHCGRDGRAHVVVGRVQEASARDETAYRRQRQGFLPGRERLVGICRVAAEQQCRHGRRVHHALHLVDDRQLEPRVGRRRTQRLADVDRLDHGVRGQVVADLAVDPARQERLQHGDQAVRRQRVDGLGARRQRRDRSGIVEVDAAQHLSAVHPGGGGRRRGGACHAVVHLEDRTGEPAAVERREHHLVFQRAEQQEVVEDVGGGQHTVDAGIGQRGAQAVEQVGAAVHRGGPRSDGQCAARGMVGRDDHEPAVAADGRPGGAALPRRGDHAGFGCPEVGDGAVAGADSGSRH
ncbi:hypothetical protein MSMEG_4660 [Mycolicibacterium smegmatis MC2 155]|uniref:Uncharacterized protein n=1 Tax=Mycolicibacterium smegmatis (strain ATCC 700084 / mc(2)155) TaxID=246196 RepID=A0R186_MYCS2|nr:hypothetical protein MSMEG_4660 [Mycolicibacterium smegmatis MC2 155]